ncbi:hypothetical protein Lepto7376_1665 [[Leptolyngbya] sp. PCC 7376]|nr:hypothetical protein Lepto7376_1665 [[Leptolyngbya] sp. PCC 7376]
MKANAIKELGGIDLYSDDRADVQAGKGCYLKLTMAEAFLFF